MFTNNSEQFESKQKDSSKKINDESHDENDSNQNVRKSIASEDQALPTEIEIDDNILINQFLKDQLFLNKNSS